ncbi:hypothetical protein C3B51_02370 [Pseudoalteromonas rubra]|uniref:RES domain-containing protein n=1 Tax=Pseudoalteromonas rubra TaxID=43658 RepID=A0A4Q7EMQ4_9GAMM|nr:RES family NAD+ phosphorylase [Pseudoalteromonas rubra]RZM84682.1 hypothetical protein C3B51_02370 [Pseudoalteromonas rubra]
MAQCCLNCFTDRAIIELIQREGDISRCSFCDSDEFLCIAPEKLTGLFELVLGCIVEDIDGEEIQNVYVDELKIVSETVRRPNDLISQIMGEEFNEKKFSFNAGIVEYQDAWNAFKNHLIKENRFFPNNSLFGKIFINESNNEDTITTEAAVFLRTIDALSRPRDSGFIFHRARVSDKALRAHEMGSPPAAIASAGRANPVGIPYLYVAEDFDTCCQEVRPSNGATIYVSEVIAARDLTLVDLTAPKQKVALLKFEEEEIELTLKCLNLLQQFSEELSKPVLPEKSQLDYIPTQFICEYLRTIGSYQGTQSYDGIVFNSSYGSGQNVVLFSDDSVEIEAPTAHTVTSVSVEVEQLNLS